MLGKRIICLGLTSLFLSTNLNILTPFQAKEVQILENQISEVAIGGASQNEKVIKTRILNGYCPTLLQIDVEELIKQKEIEEQERIKLENERLMKAEEEKKQYIDFELTFYTFLECKDKWNAVTCNGDRPFQGIVASNVYPQGTILYLEDWGEVLVWDRGGKNFNSPNRLDVFIDPMPNETEEQYKARAFEMGHVFTKGYIKE